MKKKKKCTLFVLFCLCVVKMGAQELTLEERLTQIEQGLRRQTEKQKFMPQIHGILRGKYEYEPDLNASRFEVRNARLSVDGNMPLKSSYKLEVDLCDESAIKMKDAWVRHQDEGCVGTCESNQHLSHYSWSATNAFLHRCSSKSVGTILCESLIHCQTGRRYA